jgi:FdhD protein
MYEKMCLYKTSGGVHGSALADKDKILIVSEDIGRHNTFDKISGEALLKNIDTKDKIILTTGRNSSEMLLKASNMGIPIVCTLKVPTENSISMGKKLGITLIGQIKERNFVAFTYPERFGYKE